MEDVSSSAKPCVDQEILDVQYSYEAPDEVWDGLPSILEEEEEEEEEKEEEQGKGLPLIPIEHPETEQEPTDEETIDDLFDAYSTYPEDEEGGGDGEQDGGANGGGANGGANGREAPRRPNFNARAINRHPHSLIERLRNSNDFTHPPPMRAQTTIIPPMPSPVRQEPLPSDIPEQAQTAVADEEGEHTASEPSSPENSGADEELAEPEENVEDGFSDPVLDK